MEGAASISRSLSPQDAELRDQLHVLQEREMLLSQKLALEREKRMHAERVTETQRQACMELHLLLNKERRLSGRYSKAPEPKIVRKPRLHHTSGMNLCILCVCARALRTCTTQRCIALFIRV